MCFLLHVNFTSKEKNVKYWTLVNDTHIKYLRGKYTNSCSLPGNASKMRGTNRWINGIQQVN